MVYIYKTTLQNLKKKKCEWGKGAHLIVRLNQYLIIFT